MAILFENVTQIPAQFWINKQARYNEFDPATRHLLLLGTHENFYRELKRWFFPGLVNCSAAYELAPLGNSDAVQQAPVAFVAAGGRVYQAAVVPHQQHVGRPAVAVNKLRTCLMLEQIHHHLVGFSLGPALNA